MHRLTPSHRLPPSKNNSSVRQLRPPSYAPRADSSPCLGLPSVGWHPSARRTPHPLFEPHGAGSSLTRKKHLPKHASGPATISQTVERPHRPGFIGHNCPSYAQTVYTAPRPLRHRPYTPAIFITVPLRHGSPATGHHSPPFCQYLSPLTHPPCCVIDHRFPRLVCNGPASLEIIVQHMSMTCATPMPSWTDHCTTHAAIAVNSRLESSLSRCCTPPAPVTAPSARAQPYHIVSTSTALKNIVSRFLRASSSHHCHPLAGET